MEARIGRWLRRRLGVLGLALALLALIDLPSEAPVTPPSRPVPAAAVLSGITNGQPRRTVGGQVIDAHDGEIAKFGSTYYLYGTAYGCGFRWTDSTSPFCGFNVYTSPDLVSWTGPTQLFDPGPDWQTLCMHSIPAGWGCFRPHVLFNQTTGLYVLWVNVPGGYRTLTSPQPTGPFALAATPQPAGGDETVFADADGTGYLVYANVGHVYEQRLTPDYLDVTGAAVEVTGFPQVPPTYGAEAPSMFSRSGVYYLLLSVPQCPYCSGTGTGYFMAPTAFGPWTYIGLASDWSCNGQPAAVSQVGAAGDVYLYQSDQWLQTPNEYAADQYWGALTFIGARIVPVTCSVGAYPYVAYFPWYDRSNPAVANDNIHLVNPASNGQPAIGAIALGGQMLSFTIAPGQEWFGSFRPGTIGGPVEVGANVRLIASQRVAYGQSFDEVAALPASAAATDLYFSWFDRVSSPGFSNDNVHVVNPSSSSAASVTVTIPGQPGCSTAATLAPGAEAIFTCATGFGGPVHVQSSIPVVASQRVTYYQTFTEVDGAAASAASSAVVSAWYDHTSSALFEADNVHVVSPTGSLASAAVRVAIPGCPAPSVWQYSAAEWIYSCAFGSGFGGPVRVTSASPVLVSQRVEYGASFNEAEAQPESAAATSLLMPWYDLSSSPAFEADNLHVEAPGGSPLAPSALTVTIPGCTPSPWQVSPSEIVYSCPRGTGFGGPVAITSSVPVLASQRVEYAQSFNESLATP